jgi:hypothetical protein
MTEFTKNHIEGQRFYLSSFKLFPLGDPVVTDLVKNYSNALDHIERQAKRIEELEIINKGVICGQEKLCEYVASQRDKALETVYELGERITELEQERRWIPVSESKPKSGVPVLVWNGGLHTAFWFEQQDDTPFGGHWVWHPVRKNIYTFMLGVTHWQPLPQPPKDSE